MVSTPKEMMQPCLVDLRFISLIARTPSSPARRSVAREQGSARARARSEKTCRQGKPR